MLQVSIIYGFFEFGESDQIVKELEGKGLLEDERCDD